MINALERSSKRCFRVVQQQQLSIEIRTSLTRLKHILKLGIVVNLLFLNERPKVGQGSY